jgi:hypothetical protein
MQGESLSKPRVKGKALLKIKPSEILNKQKRNIFQQRIKKEAKKERNEKQEKRKEEGIVLEPVTIEDKREIFD